MKKDMTFDSLYKSVSKLNEAFEDDTAKAINRNITARNWLIGFYIVHYEQKGEDRAKYGEKTLLTGIKNNLIEDKSAQKGLAISELGNQRLPNSLKYKFLQKPFLHIFHLRIFL